MSSDEAFLDRRAAATIEAHIARMQSHAIGERLRALGAALVTAAALTRAWRAGWMDDADCWRPGCGRRMP